jgi:hypothetical protein
VNPSDFYPGPPKRPARIERREHSTLFYDKANVCYAAVSNFDGKHKVIELRVKEFPEDTTDAQTPDGQGQANI